MINFQNFTRVLAMALSLASTPGLAASNATHVGYTAHAQAIEGVIAADSTSPVRERALRECNNRAEPFKNYTWGHAQSDIYRSCMSEHGQPE